MDTNALRKVGSLALRGCTGRRALDVQQEAQGLWTHTPRTQDVACASQAPEK